jgi:hypothetical protein
MGHHGTSLERITMTTEFWERYKDPRWQRRRLEIMARAEFRCESCEASEKTLNVHHKIYRRGAMPWGYADQELACLCQECHERETHVREKLREAMALLDEYDLQRLLGYAHGIVLFSNTHEVDACNLESLGEAEGMVAAVGATGVMAAYELLDQTVKPDYLISGDVLNSFYRSKRTSK